MSCRTPGTRVLPYQGGLRRSARAHRMASTLVFALLAIAVPCSALGQAAPRETVPAQANAAQVRAGNVDVASEHKKLQIWIGDWTYQGEDKQTSFQSARVYKGKATVRSMLGGAFVEWLGEDDNGDSWREIDGYDSANRRFFWHAYYPDGSVEVMSYRIEGNTVSLLGTTDIEGKQRRLRGTFVFAPDGQSFVEKLQVSVDGKTWISAWEIRFTKVK